MNPLKPARYIRKAKGRRPAPARMQRSNLQRAAVLAALLMALLLVGVWVMPGSEIPPRFAALFTAIWLFGAAMMWWFPLFGATGSALWGLLSGSQAISMHGFQGINAVVVVGSFVTAGLALALLVERWRARRA